MIDKIILIIPISYTPASLLVYCDVDFIVTLFMERVT